MARLKRLGAVTRVNLSTNDTHDWANRDGNSWPCSELSGRRIMAEFDSNGLCDLTVDGKYIDCDANELNAIIVDFFGSINPHER